MLVFLVHSLMFIHHVYVSFVLVTLDFSLPEAKVVYVDPQNKTETLITDPKLENTEKYPYAFLTLWNFALQTIYLALICTLDLSRLRKIKLNRQIQNVIRKFRGYLLTGIIGPFAIFIPTVFWFVYAIDRELIYPKVTDVVVPYFVNVSVHAVIILVVAFEILIGQEFIPKNKVAIPLLWIYQMTYLFTLVAVNYMKGVWIYGYLGVLDSTFRNLFFLGAVLSTNIFYVICYKLQKYFKQIDIWANETNYFYHKSKQPRKISRNNNKTYFTNKKLI